MMQGTLFAAAPKPVGMPAWWPLCSGCKRPIERMAWTCDAGEPPRMRFRADCHGMTASVVVPRHQALAGTLLVEVPAKERNVA